MRTLPGYRLVLVEAEEADTLSSTMGMVAHTPPELAGVVSRDLCVSRGSK